MSTKHQTANDVIKAAFRAGPGFIQWLHEWQVAQGEHPQDPTILRGAFSLVCASVPVVAMAEAWMGAAKATEDT